MKILFILLTAFSVSIDSFLCGFTLSFKEKQKHKIIIGINLMVLILCLSFHFAGTFICRHINYDLSVLGGLIIIAVAVANIIESKKDNQKAISSFKKSLIIGFAVGIDGATADFSLTLMGYVSILIPLIITLFHVISVSAGIILSKIKCISKLRMQTFAPIILLLFGLYKTISALF